ncbi:hypothetical protein ACQCN2_07990 [Brevibacillus ginsengisoli]|uniref:hypothetical protein n=1 Tax=Brevibacillus ginsengisoli TaxID=363854 RepID=UPI003CE90839
MKKLVVVTVLVVLIVGVFIQKASLYHTKIPIEQVASVTVWDELKGEFTFTKEQQLATVEAFNSAKFVDDNDEFAGPTYGCHAFINLKNGQRISLGGCGTRPEVQRRDNSQSRTIAYFIESPEIAQIIHEVLNSKQK